MNKNMVKKVHHLKKNEKVPLTYDEASKIFFSSANHLEPLAVLLSSILEEEYDSILRRILQNVQTFLVKKY